MSELGVRDWLLLGLGAAFVAVLAWAALTVLVLLG